MSKPNRRERAQELLKTVTNGPLFGFNGQPMYRKDAEREYRLWASTWIVPELKKLIPELRVAGRPRLP